jgi:hypothetical protein
MILSTSQLIHDTTFRISNVFSIDHYYTRKKKKMLFQKRAMRTKFVISITGSIPLLEDYYFSRLCFSTNVSMVY